MKFVQSEPRPLRVEGAETLQGHGFGAEDAAPRLAPQFHLRLAETGHTAIARVEGPLDLEHSTAFLSRLEPLAAVPGRRVVVDLRSTQYVDSSGVRALLRLRELLEASHCELRLIVAPVSRAERTLALLRLLETFQVYPSVADAVQQRPKAA